MKSLNLLPALFIYGGLALAAPRLAFAAAGNAADPLEAESTISAVTVYTDRAVVTRTARVNLTPGTREVEFEKLPTQLLDQSLQVSGSGAAMATILDVSAKQSFVDFVPNERVKALDDQLRDLQKQVRVLDDRVNTLNGQKQYVERMLQAATTAGVSPTNGSLALTATRPSLDEWQKLYSYSDDTLGKIAAELRGIDDQKFDLAAKQAAIQQQRDQLRGAGSKSYKTVVVRLSSTNAGVLDLNLNYTVPGASWVPSYDARLRTAERSIELSYNAVVRQNTGEDWQNVAMTLSTARPSMGGGAPELGSWVLNVQQPMPPIASVQSRQASLQGGGGGGGRGGRGGAAAGAPAAANAMSVESFDFGRGPNAALFGNAAVESGLTSATFKVDAPASLASDNTTQKVAVTMIKLPAKLRYESTPKLREAAFLVAETTNSSDFPLLAGTMNTFLDDVFVAQGAVKTVMPSEKLELSLGADEGIAIKRKLVNRFAEDTGLTNSGKRVTYEFLITLTNHKKTAETLTFREPVPVSRDEKIVVKILTPADRDIGTVDKPKEVTRDGDKLVWKVDLKPGEKRDITLKMSVDYPQDVTVTGLE